MPPKPDFAQPNAIEPGQMRFIDNYLPLLPAALYQVAVTQTLQAATASDPSAVDISQTRVQNFYVDAPRLALQSGEVHSRFPPANAQGVFETALPQVTLTHRGLPWERAIWDNAPEVPWLALVVLDADQILPPDTGSAVGAEVPGTGATTISAAELFAAAPQGVLTPDITATSYQDPDQRLQVVDLTPEGFRTAVPAQATAAMLASVREVDIGHKGLGGGLDAGTQPEAGVPDWARWYAVITAARFPAAPATLEQAKTQVVHLVSLEGFTDYLRSKNPLPLPAEATRIRMVSLDSWSFASLPETGRNFAQLMAGLAPEPGQTLAYALPQQVPGGDVDASAAELASTALSAGYVPRSYATRQGEQTFAWYRGPFVPTLPAPLPELAAAPVNSAQLAVYDPQSGLFDLSYATAFETGRLLALSNGAFCQALMRWQRRGLRLLTLLAESGADLAACSEDQIEALSRRMPAGPGVLADLAAHFDTLDQAFRRPQVTRDPVAQTRPDAPVADPETLAHTMHVHPVRTFLKRWAKQAAQGPVTDYLARLWLLEPVPYNLLAPDTRLLPPETFRAFYLDRNWQSALLQGALSVGISSSREGAFQQMLRQTLLEEAEVTALARRNALLGLLEAAPAAGTQLSGCLLRSAAVSGWPGLEIKAFHGGAGAPVKADQRVIDPARTVPLPAARLTRLGPQVMLGLFRGLADWIEIDEPREGLHFGVQSGNRVYLRHLSGEETGQEIGDGAYVTATIDPGTRCLDVADLTAQLQQALGVASLGPADLALQMIQVPESMVFTTGASK